MQTSPNLGFPLSAWLLMLSAAASYCFFISFSSITFRRYSLGGMPQMLRKIFMKCFSFS